MHTGFDVSWNPPKRPNGRIKNYIVYYTKNLDSPLSEWESQTVPADKQNLTVFVDDEETPYVVKVQATTDDGPGIISQSYEITTGKKQVPLAVRLEILDPQISPDGETEVEPAQPIHFRCITDGRPQPSVSYSWLPGNTSSDSRDEPMPLPIEPSSDQDHRYESIKVFSNTPTKRILLCQARNPDGSAEDRHVFVVNKPGSPPKDLNVIVDPDNRVTIEWQRPKYTNGHIMGYKVYITGDPTQPVDQWQIFSVGSDDLKFVLARGELEPDTPYYVKVSAVNPSGEGMPSDPTHFTAVNEAPLNAPADILPIVTEDNTVNISWAAPKNLYTL